MHAQIANLINCSYPKGGCVQPGTEEFVMPDGVTTLEFCEYHANKLIGWELGWWQDAWDDKQRSLADTEAQYENLVNEDATVERTEAHDALDALLDDGLDGTVGQDVDAPASHEDSFKGLDFDDLDDL